jgi:hypothetical protein
LTTYATPCLRFAAAQTRDCVGDAMFAHRQIAGLLIVLSTAAACGSSHREAPPAQHRLAPLEAVPASVSIPPGRVTTGVAFGPLRREATVAAFSISKTPTTVRQFKQCVAAGACSPPSNHLGPCTLGEQGSLYAGSGTDDRPVTCVSSPEAATYCAWTGGRLPRASEWALAARGREVQRYPWGPTGPTCSQRAKVFAGSPDCCGTPCDSDAAKVVGMHSSGDSPFGVSDVLLEPAELMSADGSSGEPACQPPATACMASGLQPGAIDFFIPEPKPTPALAATQIVETSFRCVWEGASR